MDIVCYRIFCYPFTLDNNNCFLCYACVSVLGLKRRQKKEDKTMNNRWKAVSNVCTSWIEKIYKYCPGFWGTILFCLVMIGIVSGGCVFGLHVSHFLVDEEKQINIITLILFLCFCFLVWFVRMAFKELRSFANEVRIDGALTGFIGLVMFFVIVHPVCLYSLFLVAWLVYLMFPEVAIIKAFTLQGSPDIAEPYLVLYNTKITLLAGGLIISLYAVLGVFVEIIRRLKNKRKVEKI